MAGMRMMIVALLCVLPAIAMAARPVSHSQRYEVTGCVYCDPCRAGFETPASTYLKGAKVKLECRDRHTQEVLYSDEAVTDHSGTYKIYVNEDQKDRVCDTILVSSPDRSCQMADPGRDRSRVVLTSYNGMMATTRVANNLGFLVNEPMAFCAQLLQQYELNEDEV